MGASVDVSVMALPSSIGFSMGSPFGFVVGSTAAPSRMRACFDFGPKLSMWDRLCHRRAVLDEVRKWFPQIKNFASYIPSKRRDHARPQEHHARNRPPVVSIPHRTAAILPEQPLCRVGIRARHVRALGRQNHRVCQRSGEREKAGQYGADAPCEFHGGCLMSLGPEEVEEEGGAEDGGDVDAHEDIVRGNADEVVVVDGGAGTVLCDEVLLVDIICPVVSPTRMKGAAC